MSDQATTDTAACRRSARSFPRPEAEGARRHLWHHRAAPVPDLAGRGHVADDRTSSMSPTSRQRVAGAPGRGRPLVGRSDQATSLESLLARRNAFVTSPRGPDRIALLEMRVLLVRIIDVREDGGRERYFSDDRHRWVVHRLWIAVGNEAVAYAQAVGVDQYTVEPWNRLRQLRNHIAHQRLADIDDEQIWRMTNLRPAELLERVDALVERDLPTS